MPNTKELATEKKTGLLQKELKCIIPKTYGTFDKEPVDIVIVSYPKKETSEVLCAYIDKHVCTLKLQSSDCRQIRCGYLGRRKESNSII